MPEEMHAEAHDDVDVFVAVDVPQPRAARAPAVDGIDQLLPEPAESHRCPPVGQGAPISLRQLLRRRRALAIAADEMAEIGLLSVAQAADLPELDRVVRSETLVLGLGGGGPLRLALGRRPLGWGGERSPP